MKSVCLKCNRPLETHEKVTAETVADSQGATYQNPRNGFRAPISATTIGQWRNHTPLMSTKPITWETPFGVSEL